MSTKGKGSIWAITAVAALAVTAPVFAQSHGGGHSGGGGAHFGGGGAHFGGGGAHFGGGGAHFGGGGAHFSAPHAMAGGFHSGYATGRVYSNSFHGATVARADWHGGGGHVGGFGRSAYGGHAAYGYGFGRGGWGYHRPYWGGGWWHGGWWPRAYYGWGYPWFLPILPAVYATYWWGGIPYYYADNVYYTWNPGYNGYVVTDPPPAEGDPSAADPSGNGAGAPPPAGYDGAAPPPAGYNGAAPPPAGYNGAPPATGNDVYVYPRNGQSDEQTSQDRYECHKWAVAQSGFDPTRGAQSSGDPTQYRRAMSACLDGRGYSAK